MLVNNADTNVEKYYCLTWYLFLGIISADFFQNALDSSTKYGSFPAFISLYFFWFLHVIVGLFLELLSTN